MRRKRAALALVILCGLAASPGSVRAHARLVRAEPEPDRIVGARPRVVRLWFSQELRVQGSIVNVRDRQDRVVGSGGVDLDDLERSSMVAMLTRIGPGTYSVRWQAVSAADGDVTRGSYRFTVSP